MARKMITLVALAAASAFTLTGCAGFGETSPNIQPDVTDSGGDGGIGGADAVDGDTPGGGAASHKVVYQVGGSASAVDITFSNDGMGGSSQQNGVQVPWRKTMTIPSSGFDTYSLMPQNMGETGTVTCQITVDGKVMARQSSSGAYALTTCTASLGM